MGGINLKEVAFLGVGVVILMDRGASWMFILGLALVAIGALGGMTALGGGVGGSWGTTAQRIIDAMTSAGGP